eukprot:CAMPEP_0198144630 /NCGR_PEP_ID=MMETSP1443-20131203/17149_1 /TAXON_ID=186043 /ORGANISM="Entomoneis sp., Strain CCMP2396" /LENGTH=130 /DNA_ID=CAMNT_0043808059 /DNA_START=165 /DNA_END=554 /DNA_ORIENTATION=+
MASNPAIVGRTARTLSFADETSSDYVPPVDGTTKTGSGDDDDDEDTTSSSSSASKTTTTTTTKADGDDDDDDDDKTTITSGAAAASEYLKEMSNPTITEGKAWNWTLGTTNTTTDTLLPAEPSQPDNWPW